MAAGSAKMIENDRKCKIRVLQIAQKNLFEFAVSSRISQQPGVVSLRRLFLSQAGSFLFQIHTSIVRIDQELAELR